MADRKACSLHQACWQAYVRPLVLKHVGVRAVKEGLWCAGTTPPQVLGMLAAFQNAEHLDAHRSALSWSRTTCSWSDHSSSTAKPHAGRQRRALHALHCCLRDVAVMAKLGSRVSGSTTQTAGSQAVPAPAFIPQSAAGHCKTVLAAPASRVETAPALSQQAKAPTITRAYTTSRAPAVQVEPRAAPGARHPVAGAGSGQSGRPGTHGRLQRHLPQPAGPARRGR